MAYKRTHKLTWVCPPCRTTQRRATNKPDPLCQHCGAEMHNLGWRIPVPSRRNDQGWRVVERMTAMWARQRESYLHKEAKRLDQPLGEIPWPVKWGERYGWRRPMDERLQRWDK